MSKRNCLCLSEKVKILDDIDSGMKKKDVALKYGIAASSVSTILKNRSAIIQQESSSSTNRKRFKQCSYDDIDAAVLKWVRMIREKKAPLSGPMIQQKAIDFAQNLGHTNFQASVGWLDKFKKRHGISYKTISGESGDVSEEVCEKWKKEVVKLLEEYDARNIFNADETGLFFKCLPNKTLAFKDDKCFGGKHSKERITVLLCANMTGDEKLKPLVIGKSKNPRCFKGTKSLEVDYHFNKNSWMTSVIFEEWLSKWDKQLEKQRRKIALLIDNCPAHPPDSASRCKLKNINICFLPANTTSKLQPLDQGIIKNLKVHYRKRILQKVILALESSQSQYIDNCINLRISISEMTKAWQCDVTESTIKNCFAKAGFKVDAEYDGDDNNELMCLADLKENWKHLTDMGRIEASIELSNFIHVDDDIVIAEQPTEHDILQSVTKCNEDSAISDEDDNEEEVIRKPSLEDMLTAFDTIRSGLQFQENVTDELFQSLQKCENFYEKCVLYNKPVQSRITDFFTV